MWNKILKILKKIRGKKFTKVQLLLIKLIVIIHLLWDTVFNFQLVEQREQENMQIAWYKVFLKIRR